MEQTRDGKMGLWRCLQGALLVEVVWYLMARLLLGGGGGGSIGKTTQKTCKSQSKYLVASPDKHPMGRKCRITAIGKKQTDLYSTPCRRSSKQVAMSTPSSDSKSTKIMSLQSGLVKKRNKSERKELTFSQWIGNERSLRRSLRRTELQSPYSTLTAARRRQFDKDLETVSTGIRQLRRLSQVFDEVIVRDEREDAVAHYQSLTANNMLHLQQTQRFSLASLRMGARRLGCTAGNLTESVLTSITNAGAH
ncbi:protein PIMREG isoform X2 [Ambystoma mexicanum]|uniref:protein PIMREG isoform X2 n=1 Tax=Ambystoma mexicanum TaxID=8296 RepID=UPI0037E9145E